MQIVINFGLGRISTLPLAQLLAHFTAVRIQGHHFVVFLPLEVLQVTSIILSKLFYELDQLGRFVVHGVYHRLWRGVLAVVGSTEHDRNPRVSQSLKQLLRHVIFAQRVLERQEEFVLRSYPFVAVVGRFFRRAGLAGAGPV